MNHAFSLPSEAHPGGVQLGGLGTGRIELGQDGRIGLGVITNNWQRPLAGLQGTFFSLRTESRNSHHSRSFRLLQSEAIGNFPGTDVTYRGTHPIAESDYGSPDDGVGVRLTAFSPMVPHDLAASSIPGAVLCFHLKNRTEELVGVRLAISWEHLLGCGGVGARGWSLSCNRTGNRIRPWLGVGGSGLSYEGGNEDQAPNTKGTMVLAVAPVAGARVWAFRTWNFLRQREAVLEALAAGEEPEAFDAGPVEEIAKRWEAAKAKPPSWDDPDPRFGGSRTGVEGLVHPSGTLGVELTLEPGQSVEVPFVLAWHTPSHAVGSPEKQDHGHWYSQSYKDAADVVESLLSGWKPLWDQTLQLGDFLKESALPRWLSEKILNDNTALTTNTIVTAKGDLYTLEGAPMMFGALGTLDQRLVSHPGTSLLFPDLNRTELRTFALLQAADGRLPHFAGNAHVALGDSQVDYGATDWPDLACSFIIQCYRDRIETGESDFFESMRPAITRAADWLMAADRDGDGVPEGGSSWDIEHYSGAFIATATLWMATLRVLAEISLREGDAERAALFEDWQRRASMTVEGMWNDGCYLKYLDPVTGASSDDVFIGQLAGEWVVRQLGLEPIVPPERALAALELIYRLNGDRDRYRLPPIQVRRDGSLNERRYGWHAWPQYGLVFCDCTALYLGLRDPAMASIQAFDAVVREVNRNPWATTLWHDARTGKPDFMGIMGVDWYMNTPSSWWALSAITGFHADEWSHTLMMAPPVPKAGTTERWPVVTPRYWAWIEVSGCAEDLRVVFTPHRIFRGSEITVRRIRWRAGLSGARVSGSKVAICGAGAYTDLTFDSEITLRPGQPMEFFVEHHSLPS